LHYVVIFCTWILAVLPDVLPLLASEAIYSVETEISILVTRFAVASNASIEPLSTATLESGVVGGRRFEAWTRASLRPDSPSKERRIFLLGFSAVLVIFGLFYAVVWGFHLLSHALSAVWHLLGFVWQIVVGLLELVIWKPAW
jgi:hypothetical protein